MEIITHIEKFELHDSVICSCHLNDALKTPVLLQHVLLHSEHYLAGNYRFPQRLDFYCELLVVCKVLATINFCWITIPNGLCTSHHRYLLSLHFFFRFRNINRKFQEIFIQITDKIQYISFSNYITLIFVMGLELKNIQSLDMSFINIYRFIFICVAFPNLFTKKIFVVE